MNMRITSLNTVPNLNRGFSLIEIIVVMAVIAIGLAMILPTMQNFTNNNRQAAQVNKLVNDLSYAKSEAVSRGENITVTRVPASASAGDWMGGWQITTASGLVLKNSGSINLKGFTLSTGAVSNFSFDASGAASAAVTFELCDPNTTFSNVEKEIKVEVTGRVQLNPKYTC